MDEAPSPLDKLLLLGPRKRRAFLALFAGARSTLQGSRLPDGREIAPTFGKAECGWVDDWRDFYGRELPALGLATFEEDAPQPALGMAPGGLVWEIRIAVTHDGQAAREAYWRRLGERSAAADREGALP